MSRYLLRRLIATVPVLIAVSMIVFVIMRVAPGDVAQMLLSGESGSVASAQEVRQLRQQLGLDRPYHVQYLTFLAGVARLDPGTSLWTNEPVMVELGRRIPVTLELAVLAVVISWTIALPTGVLSAVFQDTWIDYVFRVFSVAGLALPAFWTGTLLVLLLAQQFHWMPPLGYVSPTDNPRLNLQQFIWPALIIGYATAAILSRITRSSVLEVLREDYVRTAHAKGLHGAMVVGRHVLKNALAPVLTLSAVQMGNLLGGAVISETIFTLPGVGRFLVDAILHRDYPVVQTIVILFAVVVIALNLITDLLYAWFDPRTRYA
ncbi:MAG: ABC transporter permease [Candidatus Rokubacteria bacterium]|nr:ABC transporter permease [Candidatus Rokubacteria bacterium]